MAETCLIRLVFALKSILKQTWIAQNRSCYNSNMSLCKLII